MDGPLGLSIGQRASAWLRGELVGVGEGSAAAGPAHVAEPGGAAVRPGLSSSHISPVVPVGGFGTGAQVEWAKGGRWAAVRISRSPGEVWGGGKRGRVEEFSAESRRRLSKLVASFDQTRVVVGHFRFVTLTYPKVFPTARETKVHLDRVLKRFERAWGPRGMVWKLEPQKRGAPHYHLLILMGSQDTLDAERSWWAQNWFDSVGSGDVKHFRAGTAVEVVRDWSGVGAYAAKYLAKPCWAHGWEAPGRWWGVKRRELLPVKLEGAEVPMAAAKILRRSLIRFWEHTPTGKVHAWNYSEHNKRIIRRGKRLILPAAVAAQFSDYFVTKPIKRRWRRSSGGCSVFLSESAFLRLVRHALESAGVVGSSCNASDVVVDRARGSPGSRVGTGSGQSRAVRDLRERERGSARGVRSQGFEESGVGGRLVGITTVAL